jgi:hypothetical protein
MAKKNRRKKGIIDKGLFGYKFVTMEVEHTNGNKI